MWACRLKRNTRLSVRNTIFGYLISKVFSMILFAIWLLLFSSRTASQKQCRCRRRRRRGCLRDKSFIILMPETIFPNALNHSFMVLYHLLFLPLPLFVLVLHFAASLKFLSSLKIFLVFSSNYCIFICYLTLIFYCSSLDAIILDSFLSSFV